VTGYVLLNFSGVVLLAVKVTALELMTLNASRNLHKQMVKAVVKAPLRFYDVTPVGRIINRMSGDTNTLDEVRRF
jgi:ABC-type multidrug transport system fused ATPase/permease subunit